MTKSERMKNLVASSWVALMGITIFFMILRDLGYIIEEVGYRSPVVTLSGSTAFVCMGGLLIYRLLYKTEILV